MVFTFLCTTNHVKVLTFEGTFNFQTKLAWRNQIGLEGLDKTVKKDFTKNESVEDRDQTLESMVEEDKCIELSEDMSLLRSSISKSVKLCRKLRFQEDG